MSVFCVVTTCNNAPEEIDPVDDEEPLVYSQRDRDIEENDR